MHCVLPYWQLQCSTPNTQALPMSLGPNLPLKFKTDMKLMGSLFQWFSVERQHLRRFPSNALEIFFSDGQLLEAALRAAAESLPVSKKWKNRHPKWNILIYRPAGGITWFGLWISETTVIMSVRAACNFLERTWKGWPAFHWKIRGAPHAVQKRCLMIWGTVKIIGPSNAPNAWTFKSQWGKLFHFEGFANNFPRRTALKSKPHASPTRNHIL